MSWLLCSKMPTALRLARMIWGLFVSPPCLVFVPIWLFQNWLQCTSNPRSGAHQINVRRIKATLNAFPWAMDSAAAIRDHVMDGADDPQRPLIDTFPFLLNSTCKLIFKVYTSFTHWVPFTEWLFRFGFINFHFKWCLKVRRAPYK